MTEAETQIMLAYVRGFGGIEVMRAGWTEEGHMDGLREVFRAGADAGRRAQILGGNPDE